MTSTTSRASRVPYGRLSVLAGAMFVYLTCELFPIGTQDLLTRDLHTSTSSVGLLLTWYAIAAAITTLPSVHLARRLDPRVGLAIAMTVLAVSQVGFATAHGLLSASGWRILAALLHGLAWSQAPVMGAAMSPRGASGRATATVLLGASAGQIFGAPLSTALARGVGWRGASVVLAVAAVAAAVMVLVLLPRTRIPGEALVARGRPAWPPILVVCVATLVLVVGHYTSYSFLQPLASRGGLAGGAVVLALFVYGVVGAVGVRVAGSAMDSRPLVAALVVVTVLAGGFVLLALVPVPATTLIAIGIWGGSAAAMPVVLNTIALRVDPERADVASGAYIVAYQIGISGGAAIGAGVLVAGSLQALPLVSAVVVAVGGVVVLAGRRLFAAEPPDPASPR